MVPLFGIFGAFHHAEITDTAQQIARTAPVPLMQSGPIHIETDHLALTLFVDSKGHLLQRKFGDKASADGAGQTAYPAGGDGWYFEPALFVTHADGNTSTDLRVLGTSTRENVTEISLKDPEYPLFVNLFYRVSPKEDVIEAWTEIRHSEKGNITLERFASSSPDFGNGEFYLTQFHGDWANEMNMQEESLGFGTKILDSKIGVRADQFLNPSFLLSRGDPAKEDSGEVFAGSLAWSGSFQHLFERQPHGHLRVLSGMNPFNSRYFLKAGEIFTTPAMVWAWSKNGTGALSRNLHRWVRKNALRDGDRVRAILLNNWEATYFSFDAKKITSLFQGAKDLGMELFLLDDGWFGKKYPRDGDNQGLGDWVPDPKKLPNGIGELTDNAKMAGIRFGIWLEPEMVNPRSELFEKHPDWAIQQPKRALELQRNQLALDLSNPKVEAYVYGVIDKTLRQNPGISYIKWDANRYLTQPGSPYLGKSRQTHLQIAYGRALYRIMARMKAEHPDCELMICSGGGGRVDYGSLQFGHEFWPSDMTDPARRIFIQYGYSFFFPPIATSNHVTHMGNHSMKFAFDVAMSGRLGMDIDVDKLSVQDREFAVSAIQTYKSIRETVQLGDQYRLESPYAGPRSAVMSVRGDEAVAFVYAIKDVPAALLRLKGLDLAATYQVEEINLPAGAKSEPQTITGQTLLTTGLPIPHLSPFSSAIYRLRRTR